MGEKVKRFQEKCNMYRNNKHIAASKSYDNDSVVGSRAIPTLHWQSLKLVSCCEKQALKSPLGM